MPAKKSKAKPKSNPKQKVVLLTGGNPQIPKGDGKAPVMAFIAALLLLALAACEPTVAAAPGACVPPAPDTWKPLTAPKITSDMSFVAGNQLWLPTNDASGEREYARFDPCTDAWTRIPEYGSRTNLYGGAVVADHTMFVVVNPLEVAASTPISDTAWQSIQLSVRLDASFTWSGRELLVWRGLTTRQSDFPARLVGERIDPARGSTRPIDAKGAPSARTEGHHVWAGDRWFVWGGLTPDKKKLLGDGALYDPATDRWTPIATAGAPSSRIMASVIWTGSRVVVFGGGDADLRTQLSDGALYDPKADRWEPIPTDKSIFGGGHMVMAGPHLLGFNGHDSAIYDPASRTWTRIPKPQLDPLDRVVGAPWPMWIASDNGKNVVARFDPVSKRWQTAQLPPAANSFLRGVAAWVADRLVLSWPDYYRTDKSGGGKRVAAGGVVGVPRWTP